MSEHDPNELDPNELNPNEQGVPDCCAPGRGAFLQPLPVEPAPAQ